MTIETMTLGYARMGKHREVRKALESFWNNTSDLATLFANVHDTEAQGWKIQLAAGIDYIVVGNQTLYDHVLDWTVRLGLIPPRFQTLSGLERYFAMTQGRSGIPALEMTKWFDTNYHYLVPEYVHRLSTAMCPDLIQ